MPVEQASNGGVVSHGRFFKQKGDEIKKKKNFVEHYLIHDHISWLMFQEIHGRH